MTFTVLPNKNLIVRNERGFTHVNLMATLGSDRCFCEWMLTPGDVSTNLDINLFLRKVKMTKSGL